MYEIAEGSKYQAVKHLGCVEIAKLIRADIKAAQKAGELPAGLKVSVRSTATSINVAIQGLGDLNPISAEWAALAPAEREEYWNAQRKLTDEAKRIVAVLTTIHGAYNYDGSDIQTDYFNVNYYGHVSWDWGYLRQAEIDATAAVRAVEAEEIEPIDFAEDFGPAMVAVALAEYIIEAPATGDAPTLGTIVPFRPRQAGTIVLPAAAPDLAPVIAGPARRVVNEEAARIRFFLGLDD